MNCKKVERFLSEYLENELDEKLKREIEKHLKICFNCSNEFKVFNQALESLQSLKKIEGGDETFILLKEKIKQRIGKQKESQLSYIYSNLLKPIPGLVVTIAVIFLIITVFLNIFKINLVVEPISLKSKSAISYPMHYEFNNFMEEIFE